jgi:cold-inducible RNA-binding protein
MHISVNNLPFSTTEGELAHLFEPYGSVKRARIATDYNTGRSLGFGFIEMSDPTEGQAAIDRLQGRPFGGQNLTIGYITNGVSLCQTKQQY